MYGTCTVLCRIYTCLHSYEHQCVKINSGKDVPYEEICFNLGRGAALQSRARNARSRRAGWKTQRDPFSPETIRGRTVNKWSTFSGKFLWGWTEKMNGNENVETLEANGMRQVWIDIYPDADKQVESWSCFTPMELLCASSTAPKSVQVVSLPWLATGDCIAGRSHFPLGFQTCLPGRTSSSHMRWHWTLACVRGKMTDWYLQRGITIFLQQLLAAYMQSWWRSWNMCYMKVQQDFFSVLSTTYSHKVRIKQNASLDSGSERTYHCHSELRWIHGRRVETPTHEVKIR